MDRELERAEGDKVSCLHSTGFHQDTVRAGLTLITLGPCEPVCAQWFPEKRSPNSQD